MCRVRDSDAKPVGYTFQQDSLCPSTHFLAELHLDQLRKKILSGLKPLKNSFSSLFSCLATFHSGDSFLQQYLVIG